MLSVDKINKLKEENAMLQAYKDVNEDFKKAWEELKAENDRLKEANQSLSMLGTDLASANETVRKEFFRADKNKDMWREKAEKLHQTLQEIKKIAERQLLVTNVRTYQMVYYADFSEYRNEILQKITAYLKGYLTKDEKLEAYRLDNEELKAENERLKEENKLIRQLHKDLSDKLFEFQKIEDALQEIKAIAKRNIFLSPKLLEINGDIGQIQNIAITQILDLITKAEKE